MPGETDISTLLGISQALHASPSQNLSRNPVPTPPSDPETKLGLSREEYVKKQHELFKTLKKPANIGLENNQDLAEMLELYMASLDEQVYNEVELQQRVLAKADHISKSHLEILLEFADETDKYTYIIDKISQLQTLVSVLEANYTDVCNQRNHLDDLRLNLKHKYATELARRTRLDHMVRVLGQKVVLLDKLLGQEQSERAKEQQQSRAKLLELDAKVAASQAEPKPSDINEFSELELDDKLTELFSQVLKLQNLEKDIPDSAEKILTQTLAQLDSFKSKKSHQTKELVRSALDQYEAKERQLQLENQRAVAEKDIYLARCSRLETQLKDKSNEIQLLIDRSVSLILTDKQLRSQLLSQNDILKRYEQVMETSRAHIEQLTTENEALIRENESLLNRS